MFMENGSKHRVFTKQFKLDSVEYRSAHPELTTPECARNLGVGRSTLEKWIVELKSGNDVFRGTGNYISEEAKENARLRKALKDTKDALEVLQKAIGILG